MLILLLLTEIFFLFQGDDSVDVTAKPKRSFYAARDLYKYRHQYPVRTFCILGAFIKIKTFAVTVGNT